MFYSQFILAKKGPLGTIWIAAHLERKLRKNQVADTDIGFSVDSILFPEMPIALRLSSHLLLGVVRIYSRKVNYLFDDCSEALLKVKQAFRSTAVDLPPEESTAPYHSITLPETFDLDDFELPDSDIFQGNYVDHHISSKEQITLQDTMEGVVYSTSNFGLDERFGDGDACGLDLDEELLVEKAAETAQHAIDTSNSDVDPRASVQVNALFKYDHNQDTPIIPAVMPAGINIVNQHQHIEEYDGDNEAVEYAHAPCTPGVWEEPNLSNIQEISAYDDHQEPDNHHIHTITEFAVKENLEIASSQQHDHNQIDPIEQSQPHIVTTQQMQMNDVGSTPFSEPHTVDQVRSMSPIPEVSETVDDPIKVVELLNKNGIHQLSEVLQTVDDNRENYVQQHQGILNNISQIVNQENAFLPANELELNTEPFGEQNLVGPQDEAFMQPNKDSIQIQSTHDSMPSFDFMGLRPCVTLSNHDAIKHPTSELTTSMPSVEVGEVGPSNAAVQVASSSVANVQVENVSERELHVHNTSNFSFSQGHVDVSESTPVHQSPYTSSRQVDSVDEREVQLQVNNTSNFPSAPEKLLSFSQNVPENTPIIAPGYENNMYSGRKHSISETLMTTQSINENNRYSGRKRSITESSMTTTQSLNFNLNESSTFFTTNASTESFRDDDLLSTILVGRNSSILKMKPTPTSNPPTELPSSKRRRQSAPKTTSTATKTGILKRKVLMDDIMVLHGDTIRQQLTNTEDIRRLRKKAPCTHSEISIIKKQFWEDELFGESILTGMSNKLTSLQRQLYDISKIVVPHSLEDETNQKSVSHNDEKEIQPEMGTEENKQQDSFDPVVVIKDVSEVQQPVDVLKENRDEDHEFHPVVVVKDVSESQQPIDNNHIHDNNNNTTDLDYYENQSQMHTVGDFTELFGPEHDILEHASTTTAMEIDDNGFQDVPDVGVSAIQHSEVEIESLTNADVAQSDTNDTSAAPPPHSEVEKTSRKVVSLLTGPPPGFDVAYKKINLESVESDTIPIPPMDININKSVENNVGIEVKIDDADGSVREIAEERQEEFVADGLKSDIVVVTLEQEDTEIRNSIEEEIVNKHVENLVSNGEESVPVAAAGYDGEDYPVLEDVLLDEREKTGHHQVTDNRVHVDVNVNDNDYMYSGAAVDTDFLNFDDVDDDEAGEAGDDDYMPADGEETKMLDNSGWSSRTRAVAKYLQIMFDKEGERGRNMLAVNNLLAGKTRKEASRMFFETLVLKTKDYIHVEQTDPFENINVFPRAKLLKSEFYKD